MAPGTRAAPAFWYGETRPPAWALLLEPVYRGLTALRRAGYRTGVLGSGHPGCPVIIVGNLTAGGSGKTPVVTWLARALAARGHRPAVVSRGYGGAEPRTPHLVSRGDDPAFTGDEPLMMALATQQPVWICRDRLAAARAAVTAGADVIIADDGLQHYRLRRDVEIVVVDGERGFGNGRCLPAGPLREPASRLAQADLAICNGAGQCPAASVQMRLEGHEAERIGDGARRPLTGFEPARVHAVAGIGNPDRFFDLLARHGLEPIRHALGDHEPVPEALLCPPDGLPVLMTSKDAARCARLPQAAHCWHVPVQADFGADEAQIWRTLEGPLAKGAW